jgi:trk/ktr system potassium uptake protein
MRIVLLGGSETAVRTAEILICQGHEVIIVDSDKAHINELSEELDCSFLHGDGAKPAILQEVGPQQTDVLCCLTDNDQANILASLVGRSLGFSHIITSIQDPDFEGISLELGLEDVIIPSRTTSRYLADMIRGVNTLELSTIIKGEARFFTFILEKKDAGTVTELKLPEEARVVCMYRKEEFILIDQDTALQRGDEIVILTHSKHLEDLTERWNPKKTNKQKPQQ